MRLLIVILIVLTPVFIWTQNLVRNPSFEEVEGCPDDLDQLYRLPYWENAGGTVDVYSECSVDIIPDPPQGPIEYASFEYGETYVTMGISFPFRLRSDTIFREYLKGETQVTLDDHLYYFSLDAYTNQNNRTDHLGVYFTPEDVGYIGSYPKNIEPQIEFKEWIGDYERWKKHEGCVDGVNGANFVTIGNFHEPGKDRVEYPGGQEFSNKICLDNLKLYRIKEREDTTIFVDNGDCVELIPNVDGIPVAYYNENEDLVDSILCPTRNILLEQRVSSCDKKLRNIHIKPIDCNCQVYTPNVISPFSNIPENAKFTVGFKEGCVQQDMEISIWDRWGNLLFEGLPSNFESMNHGLGVYVYHLKYNCRGKSYQKSGTITIVR